MRNWKISPKDPSIAQYVDCYWLLEKISGDAGPESPKLNPDPAAHVIIANHQQTYHYEHADYLAEGKGSHIILPYQKTYTLDHSQPFIVLGIKFKVGALYSLPLCSIHPQLNEVIPLDLQKNLLIGLADESLLKDNLSDSAEIHRDLLDRLLKPFISQHKEDKHSALVEKILKFFSNSTQLNAPLATIGETLGRSQRTIERSFSKVTGITLKQYHSMQRLETLLDHLYTQKTQEIDWSDIASIFGFSDQPHLIRYLKGMLGATPGQYAQTRDLAIDAYGNFE